jgi:hypothetical protein
MYKSGADPHNFNTAPTSSKNLAAAAAPAPSLLYIAGQLFETHQIRIRTILKIFMIEIVANVNWKT